MGGAEDNSRNQVGAILEEFYQADVVDSHKYYIDVIINRNSEYEWTFTRFYGELKIDKQDEAGLWKKNMVLGLPKQS